MKPKLVKKDFKTLENDKKYENFLGYCIAHVREGLVKFQEKTINKQETI